LLALPLGCVAPPPEVDAGAAAASAVDVQGSFELRVDGEPVDAAADPGATLPLAIAIRSSLDHSAPLQAALARALVAVAEADQARRLPNPLLTILVRFPEGGGSANVEAGLSQELFALFQRRRRARAADARLEGAAFAAASVALDVVAQTRTLYAQAQALDERVVLLGERRVIAERLLGVAKARFEAGEATRPDVTTLQTRLLEVELEIASLESTRRSARLALARQIGAPGGGTAWSLDAWLAVAPIDEEEGVWIERALARHPDLEVRRFELAALGDDAALARSWLDGTSVGLDAERDGEWRIGPTASVPLPLFDDGSARGRAAQARVIAARHELTEAQRAVVEEVRAALDAYRSARASVVRVRDELIPLQQQRRAETESIYLQRESDLAPVLLAESDLQESLQRLVDLEETAAIEHARLERAAGGAPRRETEESR
jgi:cobalt-zinc-cadmium efflux system outer membrane protein